MPEGPEDTGGLASTSTTEEFREFAGGGLGQLRRGLPGGEVLEVPFLKVANRPQKVGLQRVVNGSVVQCGPDEVLPTDRHDPELSVSHGRGRVAARSRDARLHEIADDGKQAFELLRLDRQVSSGAQGHQRFTGAVEKIHCDRSRIRCRPSSLLHSNLRVRFLERTLGVLSRGGCGPASCIFPWPLALWPESSP